MKNKLFVLCLIAGFVACRESNNEVTPDNQKFTITVQNGAGNGEFNADDSVFVWSNPPAGNQVFDKWTGDVSTLANPNEWKTKLKVPAGNLTITATYKIVTDFTLVQETINGSRVYYYVPVDYKGIVLAFHGKGGSAISWAGGSVDYGNFIRYAVGNNYAVLITESKDRVNREWDNTVRNTNVDVLNIDSILGNLHQRSILDSSKSKYAIGMSQGAAFASLISFGRNYKAAALYALKGIDVIMDTTKVPIIWNMPPNDVSQEPTRIADALLNYNKLVARNIPASFNFNTPSPQNSLSSQQFLQRMPQPLLQI
jgi:hypothetical protein